MASSLGPNSGLSPLELELFERDLGSAVAVALEAKLILGAVALLTPVLLVAAAMLARRKRLVASVLAAALLAGMFFWLPVRIGSLLGRLNPTSSLAPLPASSSARAQALFGSAFVADFHADSLLWPRDILASDPGAPVGHVDVPRMISGNVALQGFTIVTRVPSPMSFEHNEEPSPAKDPVLLLSLVQGWPLQSLDLFSLAPRVFSQCAKLHAAAARSHGRLRVIRFREDLLAYQEERAAAQRAAGAPPPFTAGYLGIEGMQALDGRLENVDLFFDAGVRTMGLAHFYDNEAAGSQHGSQKGGLTEFGRAVIRRMNDLHMLVDLAHASSRSIADVCELTDAGSPHPLIVSHAGIHALCPNSRNLHDDQIRCVARSGGIVAVAFFRPAICGVDELQAIVAAIKYVRDLVGIDHVGFGSDFDGSVRVPFDVSRLVLVADALLDAGFSDDEVRAVIGGNQLALFSRYFPSSHSHIA